MSAFEASHAANRQSHDGSLKRDGHRLDASLFVAVALSEVVFFSLYMLGSTSGFVLIAQHFLVCLIVVALMADQSGQAEDAALVSIAGIATIVGGPIGAIGAALLMLGGRKRNRKTDLDAVWRALLSRPSADDKSETFFDEICDGRTVDRAGGVVVDLEQVMRSGSLLDKQAALATIATHYGAEFRPLLFEAVRDPSPPVRVQAAAVLTKLRNHERHRFHALMGDTAGEIVETKQGAAVARDLVALMHKDFLDRKQRTQVREALDRLLERLAKGGQDGDAICLKRCRKLVSARFYEQAILLLDSIARGRRTG